MLYRKWDNESSNEVEWHLVLPKVLLPIVFEQLHCSVTAGHSGTKKTFEKVKQRYFWFRMKSDIEHLVRVCDTCAKCKGPGKKNKAPMKVYSIGNPMERVALDIMSGLPRSNLGNKHILVIGDYFTKWVDAYPIKKMEATTIAQVLVERFVSQFGVPNKIHSDQGTSFESSIFKEVCTLLGIVKTRTSPYNPQSDGTIQVRGLQEFPGVRPKIPSAETYPGAAFRICLYVFRL